MYIFACLLPTLSPWRGSERSRPVVWIPSPDPSCKWGLCFTAQQRIKTEVLALTEQKGHHRDIEINEFKQTENHSGVAISPFVSFCTAVQSSLAALWYFFSQNASSVLSTLIPQKFSPIFWIVVTKFPVFNISKLHFNIHLILMGPEAWREMFFNWLDKYWILNIEYLAHRRSWTRADLGH